MNKTVAYTFAAIVSGVAFVLFPFLAFAVPGNRYIIIPTSEDQNIRQTPKWLDDTTNFSLSIQDNAFKGLEILALGFAIAFVAYLMVKRRIPNTPTPSVWSVPY